MTEAEKRLWRGLRELGVPVRFRRQHPVGMFVVDFAFPAAKLAIELDGGQHATQGSQDDARSMKIAAHGSGDSILEWRGDGKSCGRPRNDLPRANDLPLRPRGRRGPG